MLSGRRPFEEETPTGLKDMPGLANWERMDWLAQQFPPGVRFSTIASDLQALTQSLETAILALGFQTLWTPQQGELRARSTDQHPVTAIILAERAPRTSASEQFRSWLTSAAGIVYSCLIIVFAAILALGLTGRFPLPVGLLTVPLVLSAVGMWFGFFSRAQFTDLIRVTFWQSPIAQNESGAATSATPNQTRWEVAIQQGCAVSHNRSKAGFQIEMAPISSCTEF